MPSLIGRGDSTEDGVAHQQGTAGGPGDRSVIHIQIMDFEAASTQDVGALIEGLVKTFELAASARYTLDKYNSRPTHQIQRGLIPKGDWDGSFTSLAPSTEIREQVRKALHNTRVTPPGYGNSSIRTATTLATDPDNLAAQPTNPVQNKMKERRYGGPL